MMELERVEGLEELLRQTCEMHSHSCPRMVLGLRAGILASRLFGLALPQQDKRLFAFVETDGCFADGVAVATGCRLGKRTMRPVDYGKVAVTFVDTVSGKAVRVFPNPTARERAWKYAPDAPDPWHAQLEGYQRMPTCELLLFEQVELLVSMDSIVSKPGLREICMQCGEEIMNEREVRMADNRWTIDDGHSGTESSVVLCRHCAGLDNYYTTGTL